MKQITIDGKKYDIDCNGFTYLKYKTIFNSGIVSDIKKIQEYLIKQIYVSKHYEKKKISQEEKIIKISNCMQGDIDDFIITITKIAWILIYTANEEIDEYEKWLKSIKKIDVQEDWISEVTEFAVDCFC